MLPARAPACHHRSLALQHPSKKRLPGRLNTFPITWGLRPGVGETGQRSCKNPVSLPLPHTAEEHQTSAFLRDLAVARGFPTGSRVAPQKQILREKQPGARTQKPHHAGWMLQPGGQLTVQRRSMLSTSAALPELCE